MTTPRPVFITGISGPEAHQPAVSVPGLLRLPPEVLTMIALQLHPREVISLSLTCRTFHHGFLSEHNSYLWFCLGSFGKARLPGWSEKWLDPKYIFLHRDVPRGHDILGTLKKRLRDSIVNERDRKQAYASERTRLSQPPRLTPLMEQEAVSRNTVGSSSRFSGQFFRWVVMNYEFLIGMPVVINYKKMLVESMFGHTEDGCQWCLARPLRAKKYEALKLRLCTECFGKNYMQAMDLFALPLRISRILAREVSNQRAKPSAKFSGISRRHVQRIITENYGLEATIGNVLYRVEEDDPPSRNSHPPRLQTTKPTPMPEPLKLSAEGNRWDEIGLTDAEAFWVHVAIEAGENSAWLRRDPRQIGRDRWL